MQNHDVTAGMLWIIRIVRPCVHAGCGWMSDEIENLNNSFPYRLALKRLFHGHAFNMRSLRAMHSPDYLYQFFDGIHAFLFLFVRGYFERKRKSVELEPTLISHRS